MSGHAIYRAAKLAAMRTSQVLILSPAQIDWLYAGIYLSWYGPMELDYLLFFETIDPLTPWDATT